MTIVNNREDICIVQKETFEWVVRIINELDGTDIDITSISSVLMQAKKFTDDETLIIDLSLGAGISILNALMGQIKIVIPSDDTAEFSFKHLYYDLFYSLDGVVFKKYKKGLIRLEKSIV